MNLKVRTIEVDAATADTLGARAGERGMSVGELVAELVAFVDSHAPVDDDEIAELDRRWAAIEAGQPTVPHTEVVRWLETWGTPAFKPWHER
jgi:predicted transcriptional regulator